MMKAYSIIVRGRVQRVGYRRFLLDIAQELGLSGFVRNRPDGSVYVFIQGEEDKVDEFISQAKNPQYPAKVIEFIVEGAEENPEYKYFKIEFGSVQEELQEGFGAIQSIFMDYWNEFRDYRDEFRNFRGEFRDFREEFSSYREEFREFAYRTDESFKILMEKYGEISEKLTTILNILIEESKRTKEMLNTLVKESRETREMLNKSINLLKEAIDKLSEK
jgi:acylphosphatase